MTKDRGTPSEDRNMGRKLLLGLLLLSPLGFYPFLRDTNRPHSLRTAPAAP